MAYRLEQLNRITVGIFCPGTPTLVPSIGQSFGFSRLSAWERVKASYLRAYSDGKISTSVSFSTHTSIT
jgi:hypothetical protein